MSRLVRNLSASSYSMVVYMCGQLVLTPVLLTYWDEVTYAQWLVLFTIPAYFALSDAGISNSFGNALAIVVEQRRNGEALLMAQSVWFWQLFLWSAVFLLFAGLLFVCPLQSWLALEAMPPETFQKTSVVLAIYSLCSLQGGYYGALFRAAGRFAGFTRISGHLRLLEVVLLGATAVAGGGVLSASLATLLVRLSFFMWCHQQRNKLLPGLGGLSRVPNPRYFLELLPSGLGFLGFPVGNALINQGTTVVLNHLGGSAAVITLAVGRQAARLFLNATSIVFQSFHPEISVAYARGENARVAALQARAVTLVLWSAPLFCTFLAIFGPTIIIWWTRHRVIITNVAGAAFGAEACMAALGNVAMLAAWSTNKHLPLCASYLVTQAVALLLASLVFSRLGTAGAVLAFAFLGLFHCAIAFMVSARTARISLWRLAVDSILGVSFRDSLTARFPNLGRNNA